MIAVFDDFLTPEVSAEYSAALDGTAFIRSEIARPDTADHRHFAAEMPLDRLQHLPLLGMTLQALSVAMPGANYSPYRAYTNLSVYGDMLFSHTDCMPDAQDITALWYLCREWNTEWGGETMFFDVTGDCQAAISPRPGRLALFDGRIRHAGRPPNRVCFAPRYTFAIKLMRT